MQPTKTTVEFMVNGTKKAGVLSHTFSNGNMLVMVTESGKRAIWEVPSDAENRRFTVKVRPTGKETDHATT